MSRVVTQNDDDPDAQALRVLRLWEGEPAHAIVTAGRLWGCVDAVVRALLPGGHLIFPRPEGTRQLQAFMIEDRLEYRAGIVRIASKPLEQYEDFVVFSELWLCFRKKLPKGETVATSLRARGTGGLRRESEERPFTDVIRCDDRKAFLAKLCVAALPLGTGHVLDPYDFPKKTQ